MKKQIPIPVVVLIVLAVVGVCGFIYSKQPIESPPARDLHGLNAKADMAAAHKHKNELLAKQAAEKKQAEGKTVPADKTPEGDSN